MSQVISVRLSDADFAKIEAQAENAQLKTGTVVADILHAHLKGKATCSSCGDPTIPALRATLDELRTLTGSINDFLRGRKFAAEKAARQ